MTANLLNIPISLERKLYQLIISRLDGDAISSKDYTDKTLRLAEKGIGGFIIFGGHKEDIKDFISELQSVSEIPLFIASDIERGVGQQIRETTAFPCQMATAAAIDSSKSEDVVLLEQAISAIANEAIDVGINMPLIPVMDVNQAPENPIICTRAFSDRPEVVSWFGSRYIRIIEEAGLISCAKHFPGHGSTSKDSHIELPVIDKNMDELMSIDIFPFIEAIRSGVSSIMIGHLKIPAIDSKPATLSKKVVTDLLRKNLGYEGLIMTDALNMDALNAFEYPAVECINAGIDILLHPVDADMTVEELLLAVRSGKIAHGQIDKAISRILKAKEKLFSIKKKKVDYQRNAELSTIISKRSITLLKQRHGHLPISDLSNVHAVFAGDRRFAESAMLMDCFGHFSYISDTRPHIDDSKVLLVIIFTNISAWQGSSGIDEDHRARIIELLTKAVNSVVVSFGSPYILRHFRDAGALIAAYEPSEIAQMAVLECLKGKAAFNGNLPVNISV